MVKVTAVGNHRRRKKSTAGATRARSVFIASFLFLLVGTFLFSSRIFRPSSLKLRKARSLPQLVSRRHDVVIQADVRGNLGPASVLNQDPPGTDWIKDRWQAASDMHGTAIKGAHWVSMDFFAPITLHSLVLDWEAALSNDYKVEVQNQSQDWIAIFDTNRHEFESHEFGQSPGVTSKTPLHIVHNITSFEQVDPFTRLRVWIRSSVHGWGVSLWQVDVYGWYDE